MKDLFKVKPRPPLLSAEMPRDGSHGCSDEQRILEKSSPPGFIKLTCLALVGASLMLSVKAADTLVTGELLHEFWSLKTRTDVEAGTAGPPSFTDTLISFETPINVAESYAERVSGLFIPPTTGDYVFFVAADDDSDVFLSTDDNPANKRLIAQEAGWSGSRNWITIGGTSTSEQKRSDQFTVNGSAPFANGIHLVAGQKYYLEGVHHEGTGGDNFALTYKMTSEGDPADGDEPRVDASVIGYMKRQTTQITITSQPKSKSVVPLSTVSFDFDAQPDGNTGMTYQWRKNGADIAGATNNVLTLSSVTLADSGAKYSVVISANGSTTVKATSADALLTVSSGVFSSGFLKREFFGTNPTRPDIENGVAPPATETTAITSFNSPVNITDNFGERVSGFFVPATTGDYIFFLASDDDADLFLSTDADPVNKRQIAQEVSWSNDRQWNTAGGGSSTPEQKRSDSFADPVTGATPGANGIHLIAGTKYYIEAVKHEGGGGDDLGATFKLTTEPDDVVADNTASRLTGKLIGFNAVPATISITQQPQAATVVANRAGTFSVTATTDGAYGLGYQWQKNGANIDGATSSSYTTPLLTATDSGTKYKVIVSTPGAADVTSQEVAVTISSDATPPKVVSAGTISKDVVGVYFDELLDPVSAAAAGNYKLSSGTVSSVVTNFDGMSVTLKVSGLTANSFTVTVNGVKDAAGNAASNLTVNGRVDTTFSVNQDIGDPPGPGYATAGAEGEFTVTAGGADFWGNADQGHFIGQKITGDFDKRARIVMVEPVNRWTKGGLMVRESLDAGSRIMDLYGMPKPVPTQDADAADPVGQDGWEAGQRLDTDGATGAWNGAGSVQQVNPLPTPNAWIRIKKTGNVYTAYRGTNGVDWVQMATSTIDPPYAEQYVGFGVTAHDASTDPDTGNPKPIIADVRFADYGDTPTAPVGGGKFGPVTIAAGKITISWTGAGTLQSADSIKGTWTDVAGATNPYSVNVAGGMKFYRLR